MRCSTLFTPFSNIRHTTTTSCRPTPPAAANPDISTISSSSDAFLAYASSTDTFLDAFFIVPFHKMIPKKITLADLEGVDAELHLRMTGML